MEMAEGVRRVATARYKTVMSAGQPVLLLGDRNSNFDSASAKILQGALTIEDFRDKAGCRLTKRGTPVCQAGLQKPIEFSPLISGDPKTSRQPGTFTFKKETSFLDEILVNPQSSPLFRLDETVDGNYDVGIMYQYPAASDHAMVFARMRW